MDKYIYLYHVKFYSEYHSKSVEECGLLYAVSNKDAYEQIDALYGDMLEELTIHFYAEAPFTFDPKHFSTIKALVEEGEAW